jgi:gamma-glutamyl hydrolase
MKSDPRFEGYEFYIMHSYVNYMEGTGARVVPIINNDGSDEVLDKVKNLDGVIFPGGGGNNVELGKLVFDEIVRLNDAGHFYPAWGICLGFENMVNYTADAGFSALDNYYVTSASLELEFTMDPAESRFYSGLGEDVYEFENHGFTYNAHSWSLNPVHMETDEGLADFWDLTAISYMPNNASNTYPQGMPIVASIEAKEYPIFGTQFHPEKPSGEWTKWKNINHSWQSIDMQHHFAELIV